jgi:hypothetical protein
MTQPIAGPWLSPKVVTENILPNVLLDTSWIPKDGKKQKIKR